MIHLCSTGPVTQVCLGGAEVESVPWEASVWLFPDRRLILEKQSPSSVFLLPANSDQEPTRRAPSRPAPNFMTYHRRCRFIPPLLNLVHEVVGWLVGLQTLPALPTKT